jgi:elongin-C
MAVTTDAPNESEYVTLVSSDGFEFVVRRSAACVSGFIRRMLDPNSTFSIVSVDARLRS